MTTSVAQPELPITIVGHPFANVGMGEQMRSHIAACQSVHLPHAVLDIYRYARRSDPDHRRLVEPVETVTPQSGIRIFHVNGDEVEPVIQAFEARGGSFGDGYNIIVPAWELPSYPTVWAEQLRKFDEVWALSKFTADSLQSVDISSIRIGQAVEVPLGYFLPRKYFGIRETAFTVLHFFDLTSYATRKNPEAVLAMFEAIKNRRPFEDMQLVLKVKKGDADGEDWLRPARERIPEALCLAQPMSAHETRSLINCCDCFASLHRSEGFGRGTGEAMFLGRLALATGWSGNMDYMTKENSLLVDHELVPVEAGEYPFGEGQSWAEADVEHATALLDRALDDRVWAAEMAARGRRDIRLGHGYRAVGLRILARVAEIRPIIAAEAAARADAEAAQAEAASRATEEAAGAETHLANAPTDVRAACLEAPDQAAQGAPAGDGTIARAEAETAQAEAARRATEEAAGAKTRPADAPQEPAPPASKPRIRRRKRRKPVPA